MSSAEYQQMIWESMSEKTWGHRFEMMCREHGWSYYHTFNSQHSAGGYPDYHVTRGGDEFYAELKTESGTLAAKQVEWRDRIVAAGNEWYCWRPSMEDEVVRRLSVPYVAPKGEHECTSGNCGCSARARKKAKRAKKSLASKAGARNCMRKSRSRSGKWQRR